MFLQALFRSKTTRITPSYGLSGQSGAPGSARACFPRQVKRITN